MSPLWKQCEVAGLLNIRPLAVSDFREVLRLNEESVQYLSPLSESRLRSIHNQSELQIIAEIQGTATGFLMALSQGASYDSLNYCWFAERYESFLYIDRVVVAAHSQGTGVGSGLYREVFRHARDRGFPMVCCEYDVQPLNPKSARLHSKFGFSEAGRQKAAEGSKVVSLQIALAPFRSQV